MEASESGPTAFDRARLYPGSGGDPVQSRGTASAESSNARKHVWLALLVVLIALGPSFLGGDDAGYGEALPTIGIGLLLLLSPLSAVPGRAVLVGIAGLLFCGFIGFLPARWIGEPVWHSAIHQAIPGLANTITLQPLHSLIRFGIMLCAILFAVWIFQWQPVARIWCFQALCGGIALLATIAVAAHFCSLQVPGWNPSQGFGPFQNRNQTATLMALGAMLALGLWISSFRRRHWSGIVWFLAFVICLTALLLTNARAPLCLLIAGSFFWFFEGQKLPLKGFCKGFAIAGGVTLLISAAVLILGENVARRFPELLTQGVGFRARIYEDALRLVWASPVAGTGVGNFEAIFPRYRDASLNNERVIHPESDWLWMASELGWLSILFCGIGIAGLFKRPVLSPARRDKELQRTGLIALVAFLVNSLIDVPGHRLGTVLPILVLAGICTRPPLFGQDGKVLRWGSRLLGIGLIAFGVFLVRELDVSARTQRAIVAENWPGAEKAISESLRRTPLIWSLYVKRSYAAINQGRWSQAISDFYYARVLEPKLAIVPFSEGKAWVGVNRALALAAWKETLRRSKGAERRDLYGQMLDACAEDSHLHLLTVRLADTRPSLAVLALDHGNIDPKTLEALESARPELNPDEVLALTRAEAWKAAADKDFERAYQLGKQSMRPVVFPERSVQSEVECRNVLSRDRHDFAAAFNLCSMLQTQERWQDALQVLEPITRLPQCPDYFLVMKSEIFAAQQNWLEAWTAINERVR